MPMILARRPHRVRRSAHTADSAGLDRPPAETWLSSFKDQVARCVASWRGGIMASRWMVVQKVATLAGVILVASTFACAPRVARRGPQPELAGASGTVIVKTQDKSGGAFPGIVVE